jgi:hypothetical protein
MSLEEVEDGEEEETGRKGAGGKRALLRHAGRGQGFTFSGRGLERDQ